MHPERGLLMPGAFIQAAEETGLIREMGMWTLDAACSPVGRVAKRTGAATPWYPSTSPCCSSHDPRCRQGRAVGHAATTSAGQLELELTESALMSDAEGAHDAPWAGLREVGAVLVVDDFGTGYSSLSYMKLLRRRSSRSTAASCATCPTTPTTRH
jgi:EAL domain-containing protein (putative c-di-GMP-specific phosphodiesterase class I)